MLVLVGLKWLVAVALIAEKVGATAAVVGFGFIEVQHIWVESKMHLAADVADLGIQMDGCIVQQVVDFFIEILVRIGVLDSCSIGANGR